MRESGDAIARSLGITKGMKVADVGCGDGTTAIPAAQLGADVLGVDISSPLVAAANRRAKEMGLGNIRFQEGDASDLAGVPDKTFAFVVSVFGAMIATRPADGARSLVRVAKPGGRIVMGNWIPGDPTLVAQLLKISSSYSPAPAPGFISPMLWGVEKDIHERFGAAGIPADRITCARDTYMFNYPGSPANFVNEFRHYYGPTMNAFAAAEQNGRAEDLAKELVELFTAQNTSSNGVCSIPATFMRVTVNV